MAMSGTPGRGTVQERGRNVRAVVDRIGKYSVQLRNMVGVVREVAHEDTAYLDWIGVGVAFAMRGWGSLP